MPTITLDIDITREKEYWVAYVDGKFFCTADSYSEAEEEVKKKFLKGE